MTLTILWKAWGQLALRILAAAGSLASLAALLVVFLPTNHPWWATALLWFAALLFVILVILEWHANRKKRIYAIGDRQGISAYMHTWIENSGRVAIWTRDMSWAETLSARSLLIAKARAGELIVCLPAHTEFSKELAYRGAEVCTYGNSGFELPASRFTIAFFGRDGARVAVGRTHGDIHVIEEFTAADHPTLHLAGDLISLARAQFTERQ
jgi:hypothetical protein